MLQGPSRHALELFNRKVEKLAALSFAQIMRAGYSFKTVTDKLGSRVLESQLPPVEATDAFVLTLRFFLQDNEPTSFRNLAAIYGTLADTDPSRVAFEAHRRNLNSVLDSPVPFPDGSVPTLRDYLYVTVYGEAAHSSPVQRQRYLQWHSHPVTGINAYKNFCLALSFVFDYAEKVAVVNQRLLAGAA